ncbi:permease [Bacillus sp. SRB_28]|nr:permease [Bacillus sp. SRB_28]
MQPPFICHKCKKRIMRKQDLITATWYFRLYLFHYTCFKQQLLISRFIPINTLFVFFLIVYGLIAGSILMITEPSIIWLVFSIPILYRFLSYYYIERYFSK